MREAEPEPITIKDVAAGLAVLKVAIERSPIAVAFGLLVEKSREFDAEYQAALGRAQATRSA